MATDISLSQNLAQGDVIDKACVSLISTKTYHVFRRTFVIDGNCQCMQQNICCWFKVTWKNVIHVLCQACGIMWVLEWEQSLRFLSHVHRKLIYSIDPRDSGASRVIHVKSTGATQWKPMCNWFNYTTIHNISMYADDLAKYIKQLII